MIANRHLHVWRLHPDGRHNSTGDRTTRVRLQRPHPSPLSRPSSSVHCPAPSVSLCSTFGSFCWSPPQGGMGVPRAKKPVNTGSHWVTLCKAGNVQIHSLNIRTKHCLLGLVESLQADSVSEVAGLRATAGTQQKWETWG